LTLGKVPDSPVAMLAPMFAMPGGGRTTFKHQPSTRPTRAEIDLSALSHNLRATRARLRDAKLYAVVKADAYGHGLGPIARAFESQGVDGLCVALAEEGLMLRAVGVTSPILILSGGNGDAHERVLSAHLTPVVYDYTQAAAFARAAHDKPVAVHLKIDTGMSRLGVTLPELGALLDALRGLPNLRLEGVMTHLASAESDDALTALQLRRFDEALALVRAAGHAPRFVHAANSAGTFLHVAAQHDLVRIGLALYGVAPVPSLQPELRPVLALRSEVLALREIPEGAGVGYDQTFRASRPTRIATVPIGYGDGLMRAAGNRGVMLVGATRCPIVGRISMDLTTLDVTDLPACAIGDEVMVIGAQGDARLSASDLAAACGTIAYEVLTNISPRVPRVYL
jgi:alanine racemase